MLELGYFGGGLASLGPIVFAVLHSLYSAEHFSTWRWLLPGIALSSALVFLGGIVYQNNRSAGRLLSLFGLTAFLGLAAPRVWNVPALALLFLVSIGAIWYVLHGRVQIGQELRTNRVEVALAAARAAALGSAVLWTLTVMIQAVTSPIAPVFLAGSILISAAFTVRWLWQEKRQRNIHALWTSGALLVLGAGAILAWGDWLKMLTFAMAIPAGTLVFGKYMPRFDAEGESDLIDLFFAHPERLLVFTFIALCAIGSVLLTLPQAAADGVVVHFVDAAFTAVSAVCVTGLSVIDISKDLSAFGQFLLLLLIQVGGLGIMSFATIAFSLLGRRLSIRQEGAVSGMFGPENRGLSLEGAVRRVFVITFVAEIVGAAFLTGIFFSLGDGFWFAIWRGLFTSISAFCNAGYALQTDNLIPYQENPFILHIVAALIILGGLSPAVIASGPSLLRRRQVGIQVKLVLLVTAILLVTGTIAIAMFEWSNTLADMSFWNRIHNAWFQSVTARTAGFNSIDLAVARPATLSLIMALMFIGGSPGGTAGGIKTTTAAVLLLAVVAAFRAQWRIRAFGRYIPHSNVYKSAAIVTAFVLVGLGAMVAIQLTQAIPTSKIVFEVISALGTVGLSIGATAQLDQVGKIIIMACMFAGRVGPLSVFLFLGNSKRSALWKYPEEEIGVS